MPKKLHIASCGFTDRLETVAINAVILIVLVNSKTWCHGTEYMKVYNTQ